LKFKTRVQLKILIVNQFNANQSRKKISIKYERIKKNEGVKLKKKTNSKTILNKKIKRIMIKSD
jgi:hypothetical protein